MENGWVSPVMTATEPGSMQFVPEPSSSYDRRSQPSLETTDIAVDASSNVAILSNGTESDPDSHDVDSDGDVEIGITSNKSVDIGDEIPLQFRQLFQECVPESGSVNIKKLGIVLARAKTPPEHATEILRIAAQGTDRVGESLFYAALKQIARLQSRDRLENSGQGDQTSKEKPLRLLDHLSEPAAAEIQSAEYDPTSADTVIVDLKEYQEGSFLFKHAVYGLTGLFGSRPIRVVRRFRDFVWLLDQLVARHPFRALPMLPPKKLAMNGHYLSGDSSAFLERRRLGLSRFINLVVKHPALFDDPAVHAFLIVDGPNWQAAKQAALNDPNSKGDLDEEVTSLSPVFMAEWQAEHESQRWRQIRTATEQGVMQVTALCLAVEREVARHRVGASDAASLGRGFHALGAILPDMYPDEDVEFSNVTRAAVVLGDKLRAANTHAADALIASPLEQLKRFREMLIAVRELFVRLDHRGGNIIPQLEARIRSTRSKLADKATKPDTKPSDLERLRTIISQAHEEIRRQTLRDWAIKRVVSRELRWVQITHRQVNILLHSLATSLVDDAAALGNVASDLSDIL